MLARDGIPEGTVRFERRGFAKGSPPWNWFDNDTPLCPVEFIDDEEPIANSSLTHQVDFANKFVGGGFDFYFFQIYIF